LHCILHRPEEHPFFRPGTYLKRLGVGDQCFSELFVYGLVHVDSLNGHADLARVEEGERGNLQALVIYPVLWKKINAYTFAAVEGMSIFLQTMAGSLPPLVNSVILDSHHSTRRSLQFKCDSFQCLRGAFHNLLARERRPGEADLRNARMCREPGTEAIITTQDLENTRGKNLESQLSELEATIWRERGWLNDDGIASEECRSDLPASQLHGEVPRDNSNRNTERSVSNKDFFLIVFFQDFLFDFNSGKRSDEVDTSSDLIERRRILFKFPENQYACKNFCL